MLMTAFINRSSNIRPDNITPNKLFYPFIKDVYLIRQTKMVEWMENIEKAISKIMADKVYTSAEFKRERDNFHVRFSLSLALFTSVIQGKIDQGLVIKIECPMRY